MNRLILPVLAIALLLSCDHLSAAEQKREVSAEVALLLTAVAKDEPAAALERIRAYAGAAHPLITLAAAQANWRLAGEVKDEASARTHRQAAERSYREALVQDPTLRQAHLGLAQCAAAREDWLTASREAAAGVDPALSDRGEVTFLAHAALQARDWRLAGIASQQGILRFPDDATLRRIELAVLMNAGRAEDARQAVLAMLAKSPDDADLWRHLAWAAQETRREDEALAALEAASMLRPDDRALRRSLAETQLGRGLPQAAFATVKVLIGQPPAAEAVGDAALMLTASRAASDAGELAQARAWLDAVPEAQRTRPLRLQSARLAIQAGDQQAAGAALEALIALGEQDAGVLTWAASLAETRGDVARAEAFYLKASGAEGQASAGASLRLVALYLRQERLDEARSTLATHLAKRPDDQQAKALQAQLERRRR
jgi:tetratricopeptide (TPR) repeat protein